MKYYALKNSTGDDIGDISGIQIESRSPGYRYNDKDSYQFLPDLAPPNFTPNLDYFIIEKKANVTDFISCTGIIYATGFIISENAKQIFEQFKLMHHYFYPIRLLHKNKFYQYHWLHFAEDYIYHIEYSKSSFVTKKPAPWDIPGWDEQILPVKIDSPQTMIAIRKENAGIRTIAPTELHMDKSFDDGLDLFAFSSFGENNVVISEKLKDAITKWHLTGTEIVDLSYPLITT